MDWLKKSILNRLIATVLGGTCIILFAAIFSYLENTNSLEKYEHLIVEEVANERSINIILATFKTQVQEWKNVLIRGSDKASREKYWARFQKREAEIQTKSQTLLEALDDPEPNALMQTFLKEHKNMGLDYRKGYDAFVAANFDTSVGDKAVKGIDREPAKLLAKAAKNIEQHVREHATEVATDAENHSLISVSILVAASILCGLVVLLIINQAIVLPSKKLVAIIDRISAGQLDNTIDIYRDDELGQLAESSRTLQNFLHHIADQLQNTNTRLKHASEDLSQSAEGVSSRVQRANESAEHVATAMTEMSQTSQEVARHAADAAGLANQANQASAEGSDAMQSAQQAINKLSEKVEGTMKTVTQLAEDTNNVGTVLSVIRGIAEQTNLLALNAAIEAARAGDQGRGFAVVADEVRTLAQKTQQSTAEIEQIIENVQNGAQSTVAVMNSSFETTNESAELFQRASEKLELITNSVSQINDLNTQVATAAEEQTSVSEDMTKAVVEMAELVDSTSKTAQSTIETTNELNDMAQEADRLSRSFSMG